MIKLDGEKALSTVYGPVPSWRLGRSLGIDVVLPPKKCTFDCVYCQLGKTRIHVTRPEMLKDKPVTVERVENDFDKFRKQLDLNTIDVVTFSGSGEPTLNLGLGEIARRVREYIDDVPLAILTNSALLYRKDVQENLVPFDVIVAKLDAGDDTTHHSINRPAEKSPNIDRIIESIKQIKLTSSGKLALEVMLLHYTINNTSNIQGKPLQDLIDAIVDIDPNQVQLEVPYRPPSENSVKIPSQEEVESVKSELLKHFSESQLQVFNFNHEFGEDVNWFSHTSLEEEVIELLKRRPCRVVDVSKSIGIDWLTASDLIKKLMKENLVQANIRKGKEFFFIREST